MPDIQDKKILIMSTNGFEQSELEVPLSKLKEHGATVKVATLDGEDITGWKDKGWGDKVKADLTISDVNADEYDALVIPGGQINPDLLRVEKDAIEIVQAFFDAGKPIAAICHAPWVLVEAGILEGRNVTSYKSIATDVKNAGAIWQDKEVVVDQAIITSRSPEDLPAFIKKIVEEVEEGRHNRSQAA